MKFRDQGKNQKISNKYEQDWYIKEIKRFIRLAIIADQSLQCGCIKKINRFFGLTKIFEKLV